MSAVAEPLAARTDAAPPSRTMRRRTWQRLSRQPIAVLAAAIIVGWIFVALFAPWLAPYDPTATVDGSRQAPSYAHLFGTDQLGRDVLSRVIAGARISVPISFITVLVGAVPGTLIGLVAGYYGGWVDTVASRCIDALLAFPSILLSLVVIASLGPSLQNVVIAVGIAILPIYARLTRATVLVIRELAYVEAARALGAGAWRIMLREILVNAAGPLLVLSTLEIGQAILIGSGLSFLGLGAPPPTPEWGLMSAEGQEFLRRAWWMATFPGLAILSIVMAFNLFGDALKAAIDPKMRLERK